MAVPDEEQTAERVVELYASAAELGAAVALHGLVDGWAVLSAGRVSDTSFWAEHDRCGDDGRSQDAG